MKIQEYFNQKFPKSFQVIKTKKPKEDLEGEELVIENYKDLESIFLKDFTQLKKLIVKNCEKLTNLKLELDRELEIILVGNFPLLKEYKVKAKEKSLTHIQHEEGMCRQCKIAWSCLGILTLFFLGFCIYFYKRLNGLEKKNKK